MRVLCVTKIFPNALEPELAPYNRHQFRELGRLCEVKVLALVPWYPGAGLGARGRERGRIPAEEKIDGLAVAHPRVLYVPRLGQLSGPLYAASLLPRVLGLRGHVDVVLGAFA